MWLCMKKLGIGERTLATHCLLEIADLSLLCTRTHTYTHTYVMAPHFLNLPFPYPCFSSSLSPDTRRVGWFWLWDRRLWCPQQDQCADRGWPAHCWPECTGKLSVISCEKSATFKNQVSTGICTFIKKKKKLSWMWVSYKKRFLRCNTRTLHFKD